MTPCASPPCSHANSPCKASGPAPHHHNASSRHAMGGKGSGRPRPPCGTKGGYTAHRRRNEPACQPCTDANTEYYRQRRGPTKHKAPVIPIKHRKREAVHQWKLAQGNCVDCGWKITPERVVAIDCDHINPEDKSFHISDFAKVKLDELVNELAKCEARCRNCHAIRTHTEQHHLGRHKPEEDNQLRMFDAI